MCRLPSWTRRRRVLHNIEIDIRTIRIAVLEIPTLRKRLEKFMTDISSVLNQVADGLRGPLATSITELIASEKAARERVAELEGEDVAESSAAANVKAAFDEVAGTFAPIAEVPDVEPLPDPAPVDPAPAGEESGELAANPGPVPGEDSTTS